MSSHDAVRAQVPSDVTYDTPYMHQINRECFFSCFVSLSAIDLIFTTDFQAEIESIESLNRRGGGLHQRGPVPDALHCLQRLLELSLASTSSS
jgi:hypothetical protein